MRSRTCLIALIPLVTACASAPPSAFYPITAPPLDDTDDRASISTVIGLVSNQLGGAAVLSHTVSPRDLLSGSCDAPRAEAVVRAGRVIPALLVASAIERNRTVRSLLGLSVVGGAVIDDGRTLDRIASASNSTRTSAFRRSYPGQTVILELSLPGYSSDRTEALFDLTAWRPSTWRCEMSGSHYELILLRNDAGDWRLEWQSSAAEWLLGPTDCDD